MSRLLKTLAFIPLFAGLTAGCGSNTGGMLDTTAMDGFATPSVVKTTVSLPKEEVGSAAYHQTTAQAQAEMWAQDATLVEILGKQITPSGRMAQGTYWSYTFVSQRFPQQAYVVQVDAIYNVHTYKQTLKTLRTPITTWPIDSTKAMALLKEKMGQVANHYYEMRLEGRLGGQSIWHIRFSDNRTIPFLATIDANTGEVRVIYYDKASDQPIT